MNYEEFTNYIELKDEHNPFCKHYILGDDISFYIEPVFYTQLVGFEERCKDDYPRIIERIQELINKNKHIVFVGNFEYPQTEVDESYIILEISDITDPLLLFVEDKSRGSDYGD